METKKTHWRKLENPDYIGAYSLDPGKDLTVTIEKVVRENITGTGGKKEECSVAHLIGQKPFILNMTNQKTITKVLGTPFIEEWEGKKITLYVAHIKAFGEDNVECLRVRPETPAMKLPDLLKSDTVNWAKVVTAMNGGYKIDEIRKKWNISKEAEAELLKEVKK